MSWFKSKPQQSIVDYTTEFYSNGIMTRNADVLPQWAHQTANILFKSGWTILPIDENIEELSSEFSLVAIELFSLAGSHRLKPNLSIKQGIATYKYFDFSHDLWDDLMEYDTKIGQSDILGLPIDSPRRLSDSKKNNELKVRYFSKYKFLADNEDELKGLSFSLNKIGTERVMQSGVLSLLLPQIRKSTNLGKKPV